MHVVTVVWACARGASGMTEFVIGAHMVCVLSQMTQMQPIR